jgi:hypothetical protein
VFVLKLIIRAWFWNWKSCLYLCVLFIAVRREIFLAFSYRVQYRFVQLRLYVIPKFRFLSRLYDWRILKTLIYIRVWNITQSISHRFSNFNILIRNSIWLFALTRLAKEHVNFLLILIEIQTLSRIFYTLKRFIIYLMIRIGILIVLLFLWRIMVVLLLIFA